MGPGTLSIGFGSKFLLKPLISGAPELSRRSFSCRKHKQITMFKEDIEGNALGNICGNVVLSDFQCVLFQRVWSIWGPGERLRARADRTHFNLTRRIDPHRPDVPGGTRMRNLVGSELEFLNCLI